MSDSVDSAPVLPSKAHELAGSFGRTVKRILAGNPFYLASAGLLLYGINQLTTDPRLVGAEIPMLRFNFCALLLYEIMLVGTAITLVRRKIWYDALLLFGLTNAFIIVPFSLISRAVFLSPHLALMMSICGAGLAVAKFWAFTRYAREINLPRRLLIFGAVLLLVNAYAPLLFKGMANDLDQIKNWLDIIWMGVLPALASLGIFLPRQMDMGNSPGRKSWLPFAVFFGWVTVTACHFGGIGYSTSYVWDLSLVVPVAWVAAWTINLRIADFVPKPNQRVEQIFLSVPLLLPLLAVDSKLILPIFAGLNLAGYALLFTRKHRDFFALTRLLGAVAIFCGGLPMRWGGHVFPGVTHGEWVLLWIFICFFWLIFRSRDPRVAMFAALGLMGFCGCFAPDFSRWAVQIALVSFLTHSLRWDDQAHKGASMLRALVAVLWVMVSCSWLIGGDQPARLPVDSAAVLLLVICLLHAMLFRYWKHLVIPVGAAVVLLSEPGVILARWINGESAGVIAIVGSFLLFALGSAVAFSKPKWWGTGPTQ